MACLSLSFVAASAIAETPAPATPPPATSPDPAAASTPPKAKPTASGTGGTLDAVVVQDVPIEQSILPTARPFNSAYGMDLNIMDTPRNVTIISRAQLDAIDIGNVRDFTKLTSSSYSKTNFGAPTVPDLRGQPADMFVNGMRKGLTSNGNGLPINFNSVESVNIVKGPASAIYGSSQYVGGHIDLITKKPYFDKFQGETSFTTGSYGKYMQTVDFGGPIIKDELAYRISYSGDESEGYYQQSNNFMQAVYGAISWTPKNTNYTLDVNAEGGTYDYTENWGYNRPTQNLIDNGQYFSGLSTVTAGAFGLTTTTTPGGLTSIPENSRLHASGDGSGGTSYNLQVIQTVQLADDLKLVNNSFYQYINRKTLSSYYYSEVLKDNQAYENRTEMHWDFDMPVTDDKKTLDKKDPRAVEKIDPGLSFKNQVVSGIATRYQYNLDYSNFGAEPANAWDLSRQVNAARLPLATILASSPGGQPVASVPGEDPYYTFTQNTNGSDSTQSHMVQVGPFWQHNIAFTPNYSLNYGLRTDFMHVEASDPPGSPSRIIHDSTDQILWNANVSPVYKPTDWMTAYFTYNFAQYTNTANGGGYAPTYTSKDYHRDSDLYEVGTKYEFFNHQLFVNLAAYIQDRIDSAQGNPVQQHRHGFEAELNYQPNKNLFATASYALTTSTTENPGFVNQLAPIDKLPLDAAGNVIGVNGGGSLSGTGRTPGTPDSVINFLVQYQADMGLGANIGVVITSPQDSGYGDEFTVASDFSSGTGLTKAATARIPWQYSLDAAIFYKQPRWEAKLAFYNLTDERNFAPANAVYGNSSILREEPLEVAGTLKYKF